MALEHLKFFDKKGNNITPSLSNGIYKFNIFFDSTSTNLFSSEHIFILEEVYKEYEGSSLPNKKADINTPIIIKIMRFIKDYNEPVEKTQLYRFFPTLSIDTDYIDEFMKRYSNYILSFIKTDGNVYYSLTNVGLDYLDTYTDKETELYLDNDRLYTELVRPRSNFDFSLEEDSYLLFRWKDSNFDKNIHLYYINSDDNQLYYENEKCVCLDYGKKFPSIIPVYNKDIIPTDGNEINWKRWFEPYRFDSGLEDSFVYKNTDGSFDTKSSRVLANDIPLNQKPFQINFALNSDIEGEYLRILDIFIVRKIKNKETNKFVTNIYQIAEVTLCGEVIGEDERLRLLLENFGRKIDESDCYVLRDSDIDDELPDYIYLNQKRKELLLTGDEIYNYLGSYKGFVNAMRFLGYSD